MPQSQVTIEITSDPGINSRVNTIQAALKLAAMTTVRTGSTEQAVEDLQVVACAAMGLSAEMYGTLAAMADHPRNPGEVYENVYYNFSEPFGWAFDNAKTLIKEGKL